MKVQRYQARWIPRRDFFFIFLFSFLPNLFSLSCQTLPLPLSLYWSSAPQHPVYVYFDRDDDIICFAAPQTFVRFLIYVCNAHLTYQALPAVILSIIDIM